MIYHNILTEQTKEFKTFPKMMQLLVLFKYMFNSSSAN